MRTNNGKVKNTIVSVYFIMIVLIIVFATLSRMFSDFNTHSALILGGVVLAFVIIFFLVHNISRYFEYDSDGRKVIIINKGLLLSDRFNYRETRLEFEKDRLEAYKIHNFFFYRTLIVYTKNSRGKTNKETFNITLLGNKKRRYIRQSLSKIIKLNKTGAIINE
ncbi:hypothetical protein [Sediminibacter sp. Hel_I_10]|uniref:hypothetical protein n=1 Tax=Sediminibacter sp. Hel_I_10 TaxID=1392490 RepID=UPI000479005B|nr:hypothetical protein [Sediminibacter sp. Hel_I_10]